MRKLCLFASFIGLCVFSTGSLGAQTPCAEADANSEHIIGRLKNMMASDLAGARENVGLPLVPVAQIVLVSDPAVCARAGQAADSIFRVWSPGVTFTENPPLYVVKVGTSFVVADFSGDPAPGNEFDTVFIFGPLWEFKKLMAM